MTEVDDTNKLVRSSIPNVSAKIKENDNMPDSPDILDLCAEHCSKRGCQRSNRCLKLHICKFYILSNSCKGQEGNDECLYGHNIYDEHNYEILMNHSLHESPIESIRSILCERRGSEAVPKVCKHYNFEKGCRNGTVGDQCSSLHLCKYYVKGQCKFGARCKRSHNAHDPQPKAILQSYGFDMSSEIVNKLRMCYSNITDYDDDDHRPMTKGLHNIYVPSVPYLGPSTKQHRSRNWMKENPNPERNQTITERFYACDSPDYQSPAHSPSQNDSAHSPHNKDTDERARHQYEPSQRYRADTGTYSHGRSNKNQHSPRRPATRGRPHEIVKEPVNKSHRRPGRDTTQTARRRHRLPDNSPNAKDLAISDVDFGGAQRRTRHGRYDGNQGYRKDYDHQSAVDDKIRENLQQLPHFGDHGQMLELLSNFCGQVLDLENQNHDGSPNPTRLHHRVRNHTERARPTDSRSDIRKENHECRKKAETVVPADAISRKRPGSHQERDARDPRHKKKRSERE